MSLNRYARRKDGNKQELVDCARDLGWLIYECEKPLDLLGFYKKWHIIEIKVKKGKFTPAQKEFISTCNDRNAPILTWRSVDDLIRDTKQITI